MPTIPEMLAAAQELHRGGRWREAQQLYQQILQADPLNADALYRFGLLAHQAGQNDAAVSLLSQAIRVRGSAPEFHNDLGEAYRVLGRYADAALAYRQAVRLDPSFAAAHSNLGTVHQDQGRFDEALACYERAIACRPDYAVAHYNRGFMLLLLARWAEGWPEYEWHWRCSDMEHPAWRQPAWDGSPLAGRTILLYAEQGLGDTLQFVRFAPLVKQRGGRVLLQGPRKLLSVLSTCPGIDALCPQDEPAPRFDVCASLMRLPALFRLGLDSIPADVPYLAADAELVANWNDALGDDGRWRVGIGWQGNPQSPDARVRSIQLTEFASAAALDGVRLLSLQKGSGSEQLADCPFPVEDWGSRLDEGGSAFRDTAAVIQNLDLVITCDTALAHLAGALAVPVWMATPYSPDWRWMLDRTDSPWYPTMRLFRQSSHACWDDVFVTIAEELSALVRRGRPGRSA